MTDFEKWRRYRKQAENLAKMIPTEDRDSSGDRASGLCICESCGLDYRDHPESEIAGLTIVCDGRLLHL